MRFVGTFVALAFVAGCGKGAPPGAGAAPRPSAVLVAASEKPVASGTRGDKSDETVGTAQDSLPFQPGADRIASIAWRTWVYTDTGPKRTRFGYLRAGAIVPRRGPEIRNEGCPGGWYRINPRGFVCVGHGATLELDSPVVLEADVRPRRGEGLPYLYAMAKDPGPHFYFRLPSPDEMKTVEGPAYAVRAVEWRERVKHGGFEELIGPIEAPPPFVPRAGGTSLTKPYGTQEGLHRTVQAGQSVSSLIRFILCWAGNLAAGC